MTRDEALEYCYDHENQFKSDAWASGENGSEQFDCLVTLLRDGTIKPSELADYGMDYTD